MFLSRNVSVPYVNITELKVMTGSVRGVEILHNIKTDLSNEGGFRILFLNVKESNLGFSRDCMGVGAYVNCVITTTSKQKHFDFNQLYLIYTQDRPTLNVFPIQAFMKKKKKNNILCFIHS